MKLLFPLLHNIYDNVNSNLILKPMCNNDRIYMP